ncbi:aldose epimerase family protein [Staphylococcus sp. 17KM0847]|uniref:aldose epimerase family protein n=1 Tax=Staphylococcus sp. 17KM0847 TaxID=2583989 RepID=UPI0015DCF52F|nr:aldose epimerase family protein [Staphylococcus sp. 17KM0847]QLK86695.1 galactose mutarotase [Staphylococcus sp. 17KM0847]
MDVSIEKQSNGIELIRIKASNSEIVFSNYGASIVSWTIHDNNIVLGNEEEADIFYPEHPFYFGAVVGRYAGRIAEGRFQLNNQVYQLEQNDAPHHLHGGRHGLWQRIFLYDVIESSDEVKVIFTDTLLSDDDHFPGDVTIKVVYTYDHSQTWDIEYFATTSEDTLFNPTNHVYFNLNEDNKVIDNHVIISNALKMFPLDDKGMPVLAPIDLSKRFETHHIALNMLLTSTDRCIAEQINKVGGLDHPFEVEGCSFTLSNGIYDLYVTTDRPYFIMYTLNQPESWNSHRNVYHAHSGVTIETQNMPNDINIMHEQAPSILKSDTPFYAKTSYQLKIK